MSSKPYYLLLLQFCEGVEACKVRLTLKGTDADVAFMLIQQVSKRASTLLSFAPKVTEDGIGLEGVGKGVQITNILELAHCGFWIQGAKGAVKILPLGISVMTI